MDPAQMAGGGGMPQGGQAPQGMSPQTQVSPEQVNTANPGKILEALKAAVQQTVDQQGYVDIEKLIMSWPMIAKQFGITVPFATVWQMIEQNPNMLEDIVTNMGLAGIISKGQRISAQQLVGQGTGAVQGG